MVTVAISFPAVIRKYATTFHQHMQEKEKYNSKNSPEYLNCANPADFDILIANNCFNCFARLLVRGYLEFFAFLIVKFLWPIQKTRDREPAVSKLLSVRQLKMIFRALSVAFSPEK